MTRGLTARAPLRAGLEARREQLENEHIFLNHWGQNKPSVARWDKRSCAAGAWLSVFPNRLNGNGMSADKWRDNVHLQYNHSPLDMPTACDGCRAKMIVEHALSCKMGGLAISSTNHVVDELRHLCSTTLSPGQVKCKPRIFSCASCQAGVAAGTTTPSSTSPLTAETQHQTGFHPV